MSRSASMTSNAVPLANSADPSIANFNDPTQLLITRLENWSHAVTLMEDFIESHAVTQKSITSGLEKSRKSIADAPRFDQETTPLSHGSTASPHPAASGGDASAASEASTGPLGISDCFATMRARTERLINLSMETESSLRTSVLPQLNTLQGDIEKHLKGLRGTNVKSGKEVEKAIQTTVKAIENLSINTTHFESFAGATSGPHSHDSDLKRDPYVSHRYVLSCVDDQIAKENQQIDTIIYTEKNFQTLERHIVQVLQQASHLVNQILSKYSQEKVNTYSTIASDFSRIPEDYEWNSFVNRRASSLVDPAHPNKRDFATINFTNKNHISTAPVVTGMLQRKEGLAMLKSYSTGYYVVTHSGFLHQYNSQDPVRDPMPVFSLYLPDTQLGPMSTRESGKFKFKINGKDRNKTISIKKSTYYFKTSTFDELAQWYDAIAQASGSTHANQPGASAVGAGTLSETDDETSPVTSPVHTNVVAPESAAPTSTAHASATHAPAAHGSTAPALSASPVQNEVPIIEHSMESHSIGDPTSRPF
ncbi:hypothetical protein NADFUDRAFT_45544 [Nadsonia fulvescens var. elongata DSM 6958]|uniref:PH domain-containing protein n=1 Tax=Nadsonia fulvescens var. elongata DSM 6958 TaxID=857566 RepID=A0A1E3PPT7_9ASCO|nr:hypothetical protein NADFUDRAFT_45544 [Nadsonia fulvescens var. elongata DSM 6958]